MKFDETVYNYKMRIVIDDKLGRRVNRYFDDCCAADHHHCIIRRTKKYYMHSEHHALLWKPGCVISVCLRPCLGVYLYKLER